MANYHVKLDGSVADFSAVASAIAFEEAGSAAFVSSELAWVQPHFLNLLTFKELPPGTVPKAVAVLASTAPPPANHVAVWTGAMIINRGNQLVTVWRAK